MMFVALLLLACEEPFIPDLEGGKASLVVNGMISLEAGPVSLELTRAVPYNENQKMKAEKDAIVTLMDGNGQSWSMKEYTDGYYETIDSVYPQAGESYFIEIETSDGHRYQSAPDTMPCPAVIMTVSFIDSVYTSILYDAWGQPYLNTSKGCYVSVQPETRQNSKNGFLYQWNALSNYFVVSESEEYTFWYYCWNEIVSNSYFLYDQSKVKNTGLLLPDELYFMSYHFLSPLPLDSSRFEGTVASAHTQSFYYHLRQYTLSESGQKYWKSIMQQSEASGKLFDPVDAQVSSNMLCLSNPAINVHGAFLAAPYHDRLLAVTLRHNQLDTFYEIDFFPNAPADEACMSEKTPFWIDER